MQNITLKQESNQVAIYIRTPYNNKEYIHVENQLFQVLIWSPTKIEVIPGTIHFVEALGTCSLLDLILSDSEHIIITKNHHEA